MMTRKGYLWILLLLFTIGGCESLEDTYSDYAGDGEIRYLGKCSEVSVRPGWKRLIVTWTNHVDPAIDKIKVCWKLEDVQDSVFLDRTVNEYNITGLEDGNYEITVSSVDKDGNSSLSSPLFGRPYTPKHETVVSFTRLIIKHYFINNRLVLFFSTWQDNVEAAVLHYYTADGKSKTFELTSSLVNRKYYLLEDEIDLQKPVRLDRKGRIPGCDDLIVFEPYELPHTRVFTSEFKQLIKTKYGRTEITEDFINSLENLEIDYSFSSFEDILNLPKLKKLILGKNRFLKNDRLNDNIYDGSHPNKSDSKLSDIERSVFCLDVMNKECGLRVERYNQHYFPEMTLPYMEEKGNPEEPDDLIYLNCDTWTVTCTPEDESIYDSYPEHLIDGDVKTSWQPQLLGAARSHEIVVDMNEVHTVKGIRIVQKDFDSYDHASGYLLPARIKVKVSVDGMRWKDFTYVEENTIGATSGEVTILYLPSPKKVRYLKLMLYDQSYGSNFGITLADIGVF